MSDDTTADKHGAARQQAEAALRAQEDGDDTKAADLFDQAGRTDPEAVEDVLQDHDVPASPDSAGTANDDEVARISREIEPGADAPSRAGITGSGSGADGMGE